MDFDVVGLISRWLHIVAAMTAVGGSMFMRMAFIPSVALLTDDQRKSLHGEIRSRWSKLVQASIGFLLLSGLYNFIMLVRSSKEWPTELPDYYHPVFGVKFLLAFGVFFIASALTGRGAGTQRMRDNAKFWLTLNLVLALTIVLLSGVLRMTHIGPNPTGEEARTVHGFDVGAV